MIFIPAIANLYTRAKENNILSGILIFDIIAFLSYVINPFSIVYVGDIDLIFGGIVGLLFAFKNRQKDQTVLKTSLYVGLIGAFLPAFSIIVYEWIFGSIPFLELLITFLLIAIVIGLVLSLTFGFIYYRKDLKQSSLKSDSKYTDEYLEDLLKK